jgi:4'-phosphopantetheinyl transferase
MSFCLSKHALHVSYVLTHGAGEDTCAQLLPRLTPADQARAARFLLLKDRVAFCVGRALVRKLLSQLAPEPPGGWRLTQNAFGKPALVPAPGVPDIRFNISHAAGVVAIALSLDREIGVDVESSDHPVDCLDIARSQFSFVEVELLESLSAKDRRDAFFAIWTLKEAWTKARGAGLSLPLSDFAFTLNPLSISFSPLLAEDPRAWFLLQDHLSPTLQLAVAAPRLPHEHLTLTKSQLSLTDLLQ